jgi:hypothetical protein
LGNLSGRLRSQKQKEKSHDIPPGMKKINPQFPPTDVATILQKSIKNQATCDQSLISLHPK